MGDNVKKKGNNRLLVVLVSVMSVVTLSVLGVLGVVLYKGYASENADNKSTLNTITKVDDNTVLVVNDEGKDQLVDTSYYAQTEEYFTQLRAFNKATFSAIQQNGLTDQNKQQVIDSINDFLIFSKGFKVFPETDEDYIFHDEFTSLKYDAEMMAEYGLNYVINEEKVHRSLHGDYFKDVKVHLNTLSEIEKRYY